VKRIDPNELYAVAAQMQQSAGAGTAGPAAAAAGQSATTPQGNPPDAAAAQAQYAAQASAEARARAVSEGPPTAQTPATATAAATAAPATTTAAPTATAAAPAAASVQMPSSSIAPRKAHDYWTSHIAQFKGKFLPDGPTMRPNCGPASVTMALRMIGLDIPGFACQKSEAVLDKARIMATGTNNTQVGTTDSELERVISGSGARWSESNNFGEMLSWVKQGIPVVMSGNPAKSWNNRYDSSQVYPFDGGHWVTVSGYDQKTGYFIVNDPLSQIGPIYVSEGELQKYNRAHGGLGIAVFR